MGGQLEQLRLFPERAGTATLRDNLSTLMDLLGAMQELTEALPVPAGVIDILAADLAPAR